MNTPPPSSVSSRAAAGVFVVILIGFVLLIGRVAYLQTLGRQRTILQAERQQHQTEILHARRGSIFDRNGMLMAGTVQLRKLYLDPQFMHEVYQADGKSLADLDKAVGQLAAGLDIDPLALSQLIGDRATSRYVPVEAEFDESTAQQIQKLDLPGVIFEPVDRREYPMGSLAAHILGGVRSDNVGLEGVELQFEPLLRGKDGSKRSLKDARRRSIATAAEDYVPPVNGTHLVLTIDSNIQMFLEQELAAACQAVNAPRGEAIVMDPHTGDILAMANYPTFNPANLEDTEKTPEIRRNRCLTDPYEPGSTIKPFIVGPALQQKLITPTDKFNIPGAYKSPLRPKLVTDVHYYGALVLWDVLVKSSNIGMVQLGERIGAKNLRDAIARFDFGRKTGIELPGENAGLLRPMKKWTRASQVSIAMGYEMMVTPLQLARGMCAYSNGGKLVAPRILHATLGPDGTPAPAPTQPPTQAIDPAVAQQVRRILCDVVVRGTGTKARSDVWNIYGKTGTAHSARAGSYNESNYTSSFVGGAPAENPRLVVAVIIHDPDRSIAHFGGSVAAPPARAIFERSLSYLQIPGSPPLAPPPGDVATHLHGYTPRIYDRPGDRRTLEAVARE